MKKVFAALLALALILCSVAVLTSCDGNEDASTTTSTAAPATPADAETSAAGITQPPVTEGTTDGSTATSAPAQETTSAAPQALPATNAEILAKYTEVMDFAKKSKPAYTKTEYQSIPADKRNFDSGIIKILLSLASNFMTTEEAAKSDPEIHEKGQDTYWFPVYETEKGCLLTDESKIERAACTTLSNGNVKIVIELKNEMNSEPAAEGATSAPSAVGSMFSPLARASIDDTLKNDKAVKTVVKDVDYDLEYYDCTAVLVFNPETNQIVSLDQYMHTLITIHGGRVLGSSAKGTAVLDNYMNIYDFRY